MSTFLFACTCVLNRGDFVGSTNTGSSLWGIRAQLGWAIGLLSGMSCLECWNSFEFSVDPGHDGIHAHINCEAIFGKEIDKRISKTINFMGRTIKTDVEESMSSSK